MKFKFEILNFNSTYFFLLINANYIFCLVLYNLCYVNFPFLIFLAYRIPNFCVQMSLPKELLTARPRPGGHSIQINDTSSISIPAPENYMKSTLREKIRRQVEDIV